MLDAIVRKVTESASPSTETFTQLIKLDEQLTPPIPSTCYPHTIAKYVEAVSEFTQTPQELAGSLSLAVLSAVAQGKFKVNVRNNYDEPLSLFTVVSLPPGERKSAVFNLFLQPVIAWENKQEAQLNNQNG